MHLCGLSCSSFALCGLSSALYSSLSAYVAFLCFCVSAIFCFVRFYAALYGLFSHYSWCFILRITSDALSPAFIRAVQFWIIFKSNISPGNNDMGVQKSHCCVWVYGLLLVNYKIIQTISMLCKPFYWKKSIFLIFLHTTIKKLYTLHML